MQTIIREQITLFEGFNFMKCKSPSDLADLRPDLEMVKKIDVKNKFLKN